QELNKLNTDDIDEQSKITIQINLTHFELAKKKAFQNIPESITESIDKVFTQIIECSCNDRIKGLLTLWNCRNLSFLITSVNSATIGNVQIRESLGEKVSLEERTTAALALISLETRFNETVLEINKKASLADDKVLKAYSLLLHVKHFVYNQINYFSLEIPVTQMEGFTQRIIGKISYAAR